MPDASPEEGVWNERIRIHAHDVDFNQRASLEGLCRAFLEAAWNHAETLGAGYNFLAAQKKFWVLSRLRIMVDQYPRWGEALALKTWPRPPQSIFALRDFEMFDVSGKRLLAGASAWLVLDAVTHRPQRLEKVFGSIKTIPRMALPEDPAKLPPASSGAASFTTAVRYSDLDVNRHVNSATYLRWLLDSYPLTFHQSHYVRDFQINYVSETRGGETVSISTSEPTPLNFVHTISKSDGAETCRARLEWCPG